VQWAGGGHFFYGHLYRVAAPRGIVGGLVQVVGHIILPVRDMDASVSFYRDLLGFAAKGKVNPVWTELDAQGFRRTLYRNEEASLVALGPKGADTPFVFHVADYSAAGSELRKAGTGFEWEGDHQG
jgi:catechol 2,3-dioxygenase-like lactoylglutathione lyase family enzyme